DRGAIAQVSFEFGIEDIDLTRVVGDVDWRAVHDVVLPDDLGRCQGDRDTTSAVPAQQVVDERDLAGRRRGSAASRGAERNRGRRGPLGGVRADEGVVDDLDLVSLTPTEVV